MNNNVFGIIISILFVLMILGISTILTKMKVISGEGSRKFIHIGVCNWWIIGMYLFDNKYYSMVVPAIFVVLNYFSYRYKIIKAMERNGDKKDLGTVYYAISLLILAFFTLGEGPVGYIGALGIFTMGYGDGLAAVIGTFKERKYYKIGKSLKSVEGSSTMLAITFIVVFLILSIFTQDNAITILIISIILSIVATVLELFTPHGLDNLTVPLGTSFLYYIILLVQMKGV